MIGKCNHSNLITRRLFLEKMIKWLKGAALLGLCNPLTNSGCAGMSENGVISEADKMNLKDIALQKVHHGNGRFLNPFATKKQGNFWSLLRW